MLPNLPLDLRTMCANNYAIMQSGVPEVRKYELQIFITRMEGKKDFLSTQAFGNTCQK